MRFGVQDVAVYYVSLLVNLNVDSLHILKLCLKASLITCLLLNLPLIVFSLVPHAVLYQSHSLLNLVYL